MRADWISFLRSTGADRVEHSGERLLDHLAATHELLAGWGVRQAVCDAALFHSVYGTQFLEDTVVGLERREEVRARIGDEAEELVWLWHGVRRKSLAENLERSGDFRLERLDGEVVPLSEQQFHDLVDLMIADAVEQLPRRRAQDRKRQRDWLTPFLPLATPAAAAAARELFAGADEE